LIETHYVPRQAMLPICEYSEFRFEAARKAAAVYIVANDLIGKVMKETAIGKDNQA